MFRRNICKIYIYVGVTATRVRKKGMMNGRRDNIYPSN